MGNWLTVGLGTLPSQKCVWIACGANVIERFWRLLVGCDLRRAELVGLGMEDFQVREEHWVIADLIGNGKHLRTVPVPAWVKGAVDEWTDAATRLEA
jgi:site-specific recombinase XerC